MGQIQTFTLYAPALGRNRLLHLFRIIGLVAINLAWRIGDN